MTEQKRGGGLDWFKPLWRRVVLVALIAGWTGWEWLWNKDTFWGVMTLGLLAYSVWTFFISFDKNVSKNDDAQPKA